MTRQMKALLMIAAEPSMSATLLPAIDFEREQFDWSKIDLHALSDEQSAAITWVWCIWNKKQIPETNPDEVDSHFDLQRGGVDPFETFGMLSRELQLTVTKALLARHL
jgi:hypothetical protein